MATLHPFRAVRPQPESAQRVACVPYDVINTEEARSLAEGNPISFLHVIRPEIDLPEGTDEHDDAVYDKGAENLQTFVSADYTLQEERPAVYVYRLIMDGRPQTGIFGCVSVAEYDADTIMKHELTRVAKEEDRTRHILAQRAHAEPVMLTYRDSSDINGIVDAVVRGEPLYQFTASDGVEHAIWKVDEASDLVDAFGRVERLFVADGHHRCKAASRAAAERRVSGGEAEEYGFFPAVLFPVSQMRILSYNRVIRRLPMAPDVFLEVLGKRIDLRLGEGKKTPERPGDITFYLEGQWHGATLPPSSSDSVADNLDVARLSEHVLAPMMGITDPRTDANIDFVGGIRGTGELERLVDSGKAALAISMYPTSVEQLIEVSEAGALMPPKSTWFEPKLRSGLLVHLF